MPNHKPSRSKRLINGYKKLIGKSVTKQVSLVSKDPTISEIMSLPPLTKEQEEAMGEEPPTPRDFNPDFKR